MSSHRLLDPIAAVLSFTECDSAEAPDMRRLERMESVTATFPWWLHTLLPVDQSVAVTPR
jgi:hypothetical protein